MDEYITNMALPTADVVPKSEVADLQDALKCEKETNKHLSDEYIALMKENEKLTINMNAYGLTAKRLAEEKAEVAREIFEEIYKSVASKIPMQIRPIFKGDLGFDAGLINGKRDALIEVLALIAELKKKYTKENTENENQN